jgi:hypothetical protein
VPAGNVISQSPHAGTHVAGNTAVSLTESAGKGPGLSPSFCTAPKSLAGLMPGRPAGWTGRPGRDDH